MSIIIDPELRNQFKLATLAQGRDMSTVLVEFMKQYVDKHLPPGLRQKKGGRK